MKSILKTMFRLAIFFTVLFFNQGASADVVWNEPVDGDLSSNPASPTAVPFITGTNTVIGSLSVPAGDLRDYLTFTIGANQHLTGLTLDAFTANGPGFQGINSGSTSFIPGTDTASSFLGLEFVLVDFVGTDMLPDLAAGANGSIGFTIPLGPGTYSYVIQEITPGQANSYQLSFSVIPEPSTAGLWCLAGLVAAIRRRRLNHEG